MKEKAKLKVTVLGSGTSQGIPMIGCNCHVCKSPDSKDNRLRCSVMLSLNRKNVVIDTGPDFRQQMLRKNVTSLEAVIFTHEHKDHVAGLDDVRAFNYLQRRDMPVYCSEQVERALRREFEYAFIENKYPGVPQIELNRIENNNHFYIFDDMEVIPIEVMHFKMPVLGFRIGKFAYITDAKTVVDSEVEKLKGVEIMIVNALRKEEHISHFNLEQALEFIHKIKPKQAYLTHISHLFGTHEEIIKLLPDHVSVAYDGLEITID